MTLKRTAINLRIEPELKERLVRYQKTLDSRSVNWIITQAIEDYLLKWEIISDSTIKGANEIK